MDNMININFYWILSAAHSKNFFFGCFFCLSKPFGAVKMFRFSTLGMVSGSRVNADCTLGNQTFLVLFTLTGKN